MARIGREAVGPQPLNAINWRPLRYHLSFYAKLRSQRLPLEFALSRA